MKQLGNIELLLIVFTILFIGGCWSPSTPVPQEEQVIEGDFKQLFRPEYDYMTGYNIFGYGQNYVFDAFEKCNTEFYAFQSDVFSPAVTLENRDSCYAFGYRNATLNSEYEIDNKGYILALPDINSKEDPDILGFTRAPGQPGISMSFIFVEAIQSQYSNEFEYVKEITVIHELGHMIADLSHLCKNDSTLDTSHNNRDCVMASGLYSKCTQEQTQHDFCTNDRHRISIIKW